MSASRLNRVLDRRPFAADEVEPDAHRLERQQQIREEDRRVDLDPADRLQRDFGREIGRPAELEQRVALAQRAVLAHVAAGLAHEPDRRGVDRLQAAGSEESGTGVGQWVTLRRLRARPTRSSSHSGLNLSSAPSSRSSRRHRVVEEVVAGDDRDRDVALVVVGPQPAQEAEAVDQRHPQVEDDGVGLAARRLAQARFGVHRRPDVVALEPQHPGERLRHPLVVVDDEDCCDSPRSLGVDGRHTRLL